MKNSNLSNSIICSFIATLITIVFILSRVGLDPSLSVEAVLFLGLLHFLLLCPNFLSRFGKNYPLLNKESFLLLVSLLVLPLIAFLLPAIKSVFWILSPLGYLMWTIKFKETIDIFKNLQLIGFCLFVGFWTACYLFVSEYSTSLYIECLSLGGIAGSGEIDTLFHSTLANVINNYHAVSTGLDGLIYTPYHIASHFIFGQLASILNLDGLSFYLVGFSVLGVPLFIKALLTFISSINSLWLKPLNLLVLASGLTGLMQPSVADWMGIWSNQLNSQSYCLALTFFFLLASIVLDTYRSGVEATKNVAQKAILLLVISLATTVLIWTKVSVGVLFCALASFLFVRIKAYKSKFYSLLFGMICLFSAIAYFSNLFKAPVDFVLFAFYKFQVKPNFLLFHFIFFYLWVWLLSFYSFKSKLKNAERIPLETAVIFALIASLPGCLAELPGGSEVYFSNVQYWFSLALLIGLNIPILLSETVALKSLVAILILLAGNNLVFSTAKLFSHQYKVRKTLSERSDSISNTSQLLKVITANTKNKSIKSIASSFRIIMILAHAQNGLESTNSYQILRGLRNLCDDKKVKYNETLLFIPQTAKAYWYMLDNRLNAPITSTFIAPAFSGFAMLDGLPPIEAKSNIYLFNNYHLRDKEQSLLDIEPETVCAKAAQKGFSYVLYFDQNSKSAKLFYKGKLLD